MHHQTNQEVFGRHQLNLIVPQSQQKYQGADQLHLMFQQILENQDLDLEHRMIAK